MSRLIYATVTLTLAMSACTGRSAEPSDVDAVAKNLVGADSIVGFPLKKDQARCFAKVYLESDLSDQAISSLKAGKPLAPKTAKDSQVIAELSGKLSDNCLS